MKKTIRLNERDIKRMISKVLNETLREEEFDDDYQGLEPDSEEKRAQMDQDWKDYYNPRNVELKLPSGKPWIKTALSDENEWNINRNIYDGDGYYSLMAQGYQPHSKNKPTTAQRMYAQGLGASVYDSVKRGYDNWPADIYTTDFNGGDITDDMPPIVGMSGADNGKIKSRSKYSGKYDHLTDSLDEAIMRAIRKYLR